jgi:hypothetical protein
MTDVPVAAPVTTPVAGLAVATVAVPLLQVPGPTGSLKSMIEAMQTEDVPEIAAGNGFMVTIAVTTPQPPDNA